MADPTDRFLPPGNRQHGITFPQAFDRDRALRCRDAGPGGGRTQVLDRGGTIDIAGDADPHIDEGTKRRIELRETDRLVPIGRRIGDRLVCLQ